MHRITPLDDHLPSPYELLMGRKPKSILPSSHTSLKSKHPLAEVHQQRNEERKATQAKFYNQKAGKDREVLSNSQPVYVRNTIKSIWEPGKVLIRPDPKGEPRTYAVQMNNKIYTRTRQHLRSRQCSKPTPEGDHNVTPDTPLVAGDKPNSDEELTPTNETPAHTVKPPAHTVKPCEPAEPGFQLRSHVTRSGRTTNVPSRYKD